MLHFHWKSLEMALAFMTYDSMEHPIVSSIPVWQLGFVVLSWYKSCKSKAFTQYQNLTASYSLGFYMSHGDNADMICWNQILCLWGHHQSRKLFLAYGLVADRSLDDESLIHIFQSFNCVLLHVQVFCTTGCFSIFGGSFFFYF